MRKKERRKKGANKRGVGEVKQRERKDGREGER